MPARNREIICPDLFPPGMPDDWASPVQDIAAAHHEAGHAIAAMALGWGVNFVRLHPAGSPTAGDCNHGEPPMPSAPQDRLAWCRVGGTIMCTASIAESGAWDGLGLPLSVDDAMSPSDRANFRRFQHLSPERAVAFRWACRDAATRLLREHRAQHLEIVGALLQWRLLNPVEVMHLWERGAIHSRGHIGQLPLMLSRDDLASYSCPMTMAA